MRKIIIAAAAFISAAISACAQPSADQRELARVHWLPAIKEIVRSGDLADYENVARQLNLILEAKGPIPAKDVDGNITGENIDVDTVPPANSPGKDKIRFHYGIYIPGDLSYKRAILTVRDISLSECITESDVYRTFGQVRRTTYAHSPNYSIDHHFEGANNINLVFRFERDVAKCATEIDIFQNRWR
ncbi:exported hypothetical protein [Paraburkholderia ribeironis]|uniref:Lipoprotein n=1 Tax=Paraburkholderia ribeironis TaxID=1247936 RepID=A0A1N7SMS2_9BURK|nr:hypothetical protein [Paraburkholderia ribeironis]SIT48644.1 exported hypothetical protein [Paraburkholderia ribeironis]